MISKSDDNLWNWVMVEYWETNTKIYEQHNPKYSRFQKIKINSSCKPIGEFSNIEIQADDCSIEGTKKKLSTSIGVTMNVQCGGISTVWLIVIITLSCVAFLGYLVGDCHN